MDSDTTLLRIIIENNPDKNIYEHLRLYAQYRVGLELINDGKLYFKPHSPQAANACAVPVQSSLGEPRLKVNPQDAFLPDGIVCCVCGKKMQKLTAEHLATHNGLSRAEYLRLCDYPPDTKLMSEAYLDTLRNNMKKAQSQRRKIRAKRRIKIQ